MYHICCATGIDDFKIPSANASANIVENRSSSCIVAFAASAAPLANAGNGVPCCNDCCISLEIFLVDLVQLLLNLYLLMIVVLQS